MLWSAVATNGTNASPPPENVSRSTGLWRDLLEILRPKTIVAAGRKACDIIAAIDSDVTHASRLVPLRLPAPTNLSRLRGLFDHEDLLHRYPEVQQVVTAHPEWLASGYRENKILFACHAVSVASLTRS